MKKHRVAEWIQKQTRSVYMLFTRDPLQIKGHQQTESEEMENVFQGNGNEKTAGVAIIISDKIDLKMETTIKTQRRIFHC